MPKNLQAARIVAGTLTLLLREIRELGPPVSLWSPPLSPDFIRDIAALVGRGEAVPLWVDERHPARGLAVYQESPWESEFLGYGAARLLGPFMVVEDQADREERARCLARLAISQGRAMQHGLITLKTFHDPAIVRGFLAENFVLAEIGAAFIGPIPDEAAPTHRPTGFVFVEGEAARELAAETVRVMGDFFYDGHWRHDPLPGPLAARRLWSKIALDDLSGAADPALILWDQRRDRPAAIATARVPGPLAALSILAVAPNYRGRGLGRLIMLETLNRLINRASHIRVETASYNLPALGLYNSLGFTHTSPLLALHYHNSTS